MSERLLLLLSLGPVSQTITAARKSSDLWYGSRLLSELAREAALAVIDVEGVTLVLPSAAAIRGAAQSEGPPLAIPNKLQLIVPSGRAEALVAAATQAMHVHLDRQLDGVLDKIQQKGGDLDAIAIDVARAQLHDLPELTWVAVPLDEGYARALKRAEALLHARKAHRPFPQPSWGGRARKSSVDGRREAVLGGDKLSRYRRDPSSLWRHYRVRWNEHLCGPGLLKRWAPVVLDTPEREGGASMPTTGHFAAWNLRKRWANGGDLPAEPLREAFRAYLGAIGGGDGNRHGSWDPVLGHHNASLLYEGRLREALAEQEALSGDGGAQAQQLEVARRALRQLKRRWARVAEAEGAPPLPEPGAYYAVLRADGDNMGATLQRLDLDQAQALAGALLGFTGEAQEIVSSHHGQIVYAGGDDLLALLPVEEALPAADALRRAFVERVGRPARGLLGDEATAARLYGDAGHPTLSVGLCIAHYLEPFQDVLEVAREAEEDAKQELGRDAWVVVLRKRSGPSTRVGGRWAEYAAFARLLGLYQREDALLPRGLPYELRAVAERLCPLESDTDAPARLREALPTLRSLEATRIFAQKRLHKRLAAPDYEELCARVAPTPDQPGQPSALSRFADELLVARALTLNQEDAA